MITAKKQELYRPVLGGPESIGRCVEQQHLQQQASSRLETDSIEALVLGVKRFYCICAFVIEFGCFGYHDTYPDVSCVYPEGYTYPDVS